MNDIHPPSELGDARWPFRLNGRNGRLKAGKSQGMLARHLVVPGDEDPFPQAGPFRQLAQQGRVGQTSEPEFSNPRCRPVTCFQIPRQARGDVFVYDE